MLFLKLYADSPEVQAVTAGNTTHDQHLRAFIPGDHMHISYDPLSIYF